MIRVQAATTAAMATVHQSVPSLAQLARIGAVLRFSALLNGRGS